MPKLILFAFVLFNKLLKISGLNYGKFKIHKEIASLSIIDKISKDFYFVQNCIFVTKKLLEFT